MEHDDAAPTARPADDRKRRLKSKSKKSKKRKKSKSTSRSRSKKKRRKEKSRRRHDSSGSDGATSEDSRSSSSSDSSGVKKAKRVKAAATGWYDQILQQEMSKPRVGTVHSTREGKKYVNKGCHTHGHIIVEVPTGENADMDDLFWKCGKCGTDNHKRNIQCDSCGRMKSSVYR